MANTADNDKPNILIIQSDEHGPMFSSTYGHPLVKTPSMDRLARQGATFDAAYCNSPLCVPSRLSFLTGRYVSRCKGWDNATPLPTDAVTWPYLLRSVGYDVVLSGKMHLIGPDKLHGFGEQLAYDPHGGEHRDPAEARRLGLAASGRHPVHLWEEGIPTAGEPWPSVSEARSGTSPMIEADDAIEAAALGYLKDRRPPGRPFALCVGFVAPHFPFVVPEPYFSMYYPDKTDLPNLPPGHLESLPPAAQRLRQEFGFYGHSEEEVLRARAAYYALVTYLDDKIGRLLDALEEQGLAENTVVIHTSDHGESLGEHGLWRKMNFYEQSARVPLQITWHGTIPRGQRVPGAVSLVDVTATILDVAEVPRDTSDSYSDLAGSRAIHPAPTQTGPSPAQKKDYLELDGHSLLPMLRGDRSAWKDEAFVEHLAHGTDRARAMLRQGKWKLCYSHGDPPELELYDLALDPGEFTNLADGPAHRDIQKRLLARIMELWGDPDRITHEVVASQRSRLLIRRVMGDKALF